MLRDRNPRWGPTRIVHGLAREGVAPVPGRSSVYRALVRNGLHRLQALGAGSADGVVADGRARRGSPFRRGRGTDRIGIRIKQSRQVPTTISREPTDHVPTRAHQIPQHRG